MSEKQFSPELTPAEMLHLGVFDGCYDPNFYEELPAAWLVEAKLSEHGPDPSYNYFKVHASQPLSVWEAKGWIHPADPLGWFQWYCRYTLGRRIEDEDQRQIGRWVAMRRHLAQIERHCRPGDVSCRPKQRQALLHWGYDTRNR